MSSSITRHFKKVSDLVLNFFFFLLPLWSSFKSRSYNQGSYNQPSQDWPITNYIDDPVNQSKLKANTRKSAGIRVCEARLVVFFPLIGFMTRPSGERSVSQSRSQSPRVFLVLTKRHVGSGNELVL